MFDTIIKEVSTRFGLDSGKAATLVQMLLGYMTDKNTGGLSGFMEKLKGAGAGAAAQSWLGGIATTTQPIGPEHVQQVLGGATGLLGTISSKLGIGNQTVSSAVAFLLPVLIGKLTPQGNVSNRISQEVTSFIGGTTSLISNAATKPAGGGFMKWLPWIIVAIGAAFILNYCSKPVVDATKSAVAVTKETVVEAAHAVADAIPAGAGALATMVNGAPALKVYFDTGKAEVSSEFIERVKPLVEYLKSNPEVKVVVSGFSDPTGSAAANDQMSKKRATVVAEALKIAGVAEGTIVLEKPADITGTGDTNAESRRVEVVIRK